MQVQLRCPSKETFSEPRGFEYIPLSGNCTANYSRKRKFLLSQSTLEDVLSSSTSSNAKYHETHSAVTTDMQKEIIPEDYVYNQINSLMLSGINDNSNIDNGYEIFGNDMSFQNEVVNSNNVQPPSEILKNETLCGPSPPERPPKKSKDFDSNLNIVVENPPALPPKTKSKTGKTGPIDFLKSLMSPSTVRKNVEGNKNLANNSQLDDNCNKLEFSDEISDNEMLEQLALYVDAEFPPPKASFYEDTNFNQIDN